MKVCIVGAGRVAAALGSALVEADHTVTGIAGRDELKRVTLAKQLGTAAYSLDEALPTSDVILLAVSDDAIQLVAEQIKPQPALFVHTSGTKDLDQLLPHADRAVLWPIQSIAHAPIDLSQVPIAIEGNSQTATKLVHELASAISNTVVEVPLEKRKYLHVAAVLVSNFPVHLMAQAGTLVEQQGLEPDILLPLWQGMAARVSEAGAKAQLTGPAARGDEGTINEHLALLQRDPQLKEIYKSLSADILTKFHGQADL